MFETAGEPKFTRLDGIVEHAHRVALQQPDQENIRDVLTMQVKAAQLIMNGMPSDEEVREMERYCRKREEQVHKQVRYVDQGRFQPQTGSEFDAEFSAAAQELLAFYRTPYFGHNSQGARNCVVMRILEASDDIYDRYRLVKCARMLQDFVSEEAIEQIATTDVQQILEENGEGRY